MEDLVTSHIPFNYLCLGTENTCFKFNPKTCNVFDSTCMHILTKAKILDKESFICLGYFSRLGFI